MTSDMVDEMEKGYFVVGPLEVFVSRDKSFWDVSRYAMGLRVGQRVGGTGHLPPKSPKLCSGMEGGASPTLAVASTAAETTNFPPGRRGSRMA